jgi:hypothetical protein
MASTPCCCARRPLGPPMGCRALLDTTTGDASIDRRAFPDASRHLRGLNPPTADHTGWANVSLGDDGDTPRSVEGLPQPAQTLAPPRLPSSSTCSHHLRSLAPSQSIPPRHSQTPPAVGPAGSVEQTVASGRLQHQADCNIGQTAPSQATAPKVFAHRHQAFTQRPQF